MSYLVVPGSFAPKCPKYAKGRTSQNVHSISYHRCNFNCEFCFFKYYKHTNNYRGVLFTAIPGMTVKQSKIILWISALVFVAFGFIITMKKRRNNLSLFTNILLPYELYAVVTYRTYLPRLVWCSVLLAGVLSLAFIILGMLPTAHSEQQSAEGRKRQVVHSLLGVRTITAICILVLIVPIGVSKVFGLGLMTTKTPLVSSASEAEKWTVKNNIDMVRLLREEEWKELSPQQKLDVLGVVLNIEIRYLGLNHEVYLKSSVLNGETAAHYNHKDHEIVIDLGQLETAAAADVLESLCHECFHAYQYQMIALYEDTPEKYRNMLLFQYVGSYIKETSNYNDGSGDLMDYYYQTIEIQARQYAELSVADYYGRIRECLTAED